MSLRDDLLAIEERFWTGNAQFYRDNVDEHCLTAFIGMAGVIDNNALAKTVSVNPRWRDVNISLKGFIEPVADFAVLTYEASAARIDDDGERYNALVSSGYARRDRGWKLAFHQQTPLSRVEALQ